MRFMRRIAVPLILSIPILFYSCGHRTAGKQSVSYQAGTASIFIDDKDESSDLLEESVDVPEYILRWQEEHRVSDEVIEQRIQSALKDSSRLNALSYDEMTVDACLLREGKPSDMFVYGDTTELCYYVPYGSSSFIFVNDTLDSSIIE